MNPAHGQSLEGRQQALSSAIQDLYATFSRYPLRPCIPHGYSHDPVDDQALSTHPLKALPSDSLLRFGQSALFTSGTLDDFKHFLPRLLEIAAIERHFVDIASLFGRLRYGEWNHWPHSERQAVEAYLRALWSRSLVEFPFFLAPIDDILCAMAGALDDLHPLLDEWRYDFSPSALHHLAQFITEEAPRLVFHKKLSNAFWSDHRLPQMDQVTTWLASLDLLRHVEKCFYLHCKDPLAQPLSDALTQLEALRAQAQ